MLSQVNKINNNVLSQEDKVLLAKAMRSGHTQIRKNILRYRMEEKRIINSVIEQFEHMQKLLHHKILKAQKEREQSIHADDKPVEYAAV